MKALIAEITTLSTSLRRYALVMYALFRREAGRWGTSPGDTFGTLVEPVLAVGGIGLIYWLMDRHRAPVGGSPMVFYASGLYAKYYFIHVSQRLQKVAKVRRFPVETWLDHIVIFVLFRFLDYLAAGIIIAVFLAAFVDPNAIPYDLVPIFQAMGFLTMLGFGWGVMCTTLQRAFGLPGFIMATINRILILLSGALFVVDFLSISTRYWLGLNPTMHAIILFRQGIYPNYPSMSLDMPYLVSWSIGIVVAAVALERVLRRRIELK